MSLSRDETNWTIWKKKEEREDIESNEEKKKKVKDDVCTAPDAREVSIRDVYNLNFAHL